MSENRLYRALKENRGHYTINSKGKFRLNPEHTHKKVMLLLGELKKVKVKR